MMAERTWKWRGKTKCPTCGHEPFAAKPPDNPDADTFNLLDMVLVWIIPLDETGEVTIETREDEAV